VPRMAYLVVNVTALACVAGSNLTRWDNEPVWWVPKATSLCSSIDLLHIKAGMRQCECAERLLHLIRSWAAVVGGQGSHE
jgi:hypothetical protein